MHHAIEATARSIGVNMPHVIAAQFMPTPPWRRHAP
jgi:hypothetical protein